MNLNTPALFFFVLFIQEAAPSRRARCSKGLCCFQSSVDFKTAKEACRDSNGQFIQSVSGDQIGLVEHLMIEFRGKFWLHSGADCTAVSVGRGPSVTVLSEPCRSNLDGFLCLYDSSQICGAIKSSAGTIATYITPAGFDVLNSETFPPGTLAKVGRAGAQSPDSKHLCHSNWLQAPWKCEVLQGGCDHSCNKTANTCTCPNAHSLHQNNISCTKLTDPNSPSELKLCPKGYKLAADGRSCLDVDECADALDRCRGEGEQCVNLDGGYECKCADDFEEEDGACVNMTICESCEMKCEKISGAYKCACTEGFRVSSRDPTKCEQDCSQIKCPAICDRNPELEKKDMQQCYCPKGYILDIRERTATCYDIDECESQNFCDHECENLYGGFRCVCRQGYVLEGKEKCVRLQQEEEDEYASGSPPVLLAPTSTPISLQPAALPSYIKAGSVLGITVFLVLCAGLLVCVVKNAMRRCDRVNLNSLKHPDIDMFYLQQITNETYKRLSFDKQFKNDPQRD